jgi:hypothetical protein
MVTIVSKSIVNKCRPGDRRLLFLNSKSEERADNRQKQNPVTSPAKWRRAQGQNGINGGQPVGRTLFMPDLNLNSQQRSASAHVNTRNSVLRSTGAGAQNEQCDPLDSAKQCPLEPD